MAWLDERIWCHPKLMQVSKPARWTFVAGVAYSAGWQKKGRLEPGEQTAIGATAKERRELVAAGLWEPVDGGAIVIHDWNDYNDRRDRERAANRERKRRQRERDLAVTDTVTNGVTETVTDGVTSTVTAHCEGSEGSDVKRTALKAVPADDEKTLEVRKLLRHLKDTDEGTEGVLLSYARRLPLSSVAKVRESCETRRVGAGYAVSALQSELAEIAEQNGG